MRRDQVASAPARRWRRLGLALFALLAGFLLLLVAFDQLLMPALTRQGEVGQCPRVLGLEWNEAEILLRQSGFEAVQAGRRPDPSGLFPAGVVMEQHPRAGRMTKTGRRIHVTLSSGSRQVPIPTLRGATQRQAQSLLADVQLDLDTLRCQWRHDARFGEGTVLSQVPAAGDSLPPGGLVAVVLSLGPAPDWVPVPDLTGMTLRQARRTLARVGLASAQDSGLSDAQAVVGQNPPAGLQVRPGATVDLRLQERSLP
ncbi:MAG: PASTA domain-containing protein [bacterium]|jgi:serine/threonine-protein kinase|nr:PASTA domain-containing protein [bacterium]